MNDPLQTELEELEATLPSCGKAAGRPRASDVEARMHNLIHTAAVLFLKHGYGKVSLEMIAREAHVAVRTIYVKFGSKPGLLNAVLAANRERFYNPRDLETDNRPVKEIIDDFSAHFLDLIMAPVAVSMKRMVIAEAPANPELAQTFYDAAPKQTRNMLMRFFERPEIRKQLRDDIDIELLPTHLLNCIAGDQFARYLFEPEPQPREELLRDLGKRLRLFYLSALREP